MYEPKKKVKIPTAYRESSNDSLNEYTVSTIDKKYVFDYCGINFKDQNNLKVLEFYQLLRDAFIYRMNQTEKGREYLDECWIMEQKKADRETLRQMFGKGGSK